MLNEQRLKTYIPVSLNGIIRGVTRPNNTLNICTNNTILKIGEMLNIKMHYFD